MALHPLPRVFSRKMAEFGEERMKYIKLGARVFSECEVTIKILVGVAIMKHRINSAYGMMVSSTDLAAMGGTGRGLITHLLALWCMGLRKTLSLYSGGYKSQSVCQGRVGLHTKLESRRNSL